MNQNFVHIEYPTRHPAMARFEGVAETVKSLRQSLDGTRGLAAVLLVAMVSALVVVADQLTDTWADGHLLAAWVLLWAVGFAAFALLAPTARGLAARLTQGLDAWSQRIARRRADERLWDLARKDPRVMADIQAAATRAERLDVASEAVVNEAALRVVQRHAGDRVARLTRRIWND